MKHIIFGGFDYAVRYEMDQDAIYNGVDYFIDNDTDLIGTTYLGKEIKHPNALLSENKEDILILIGSIVYRTEIAFQLKDMGFEEGKHFIWGIAFVGDNECRRLWKHIEWNDNPVGRNACENNEYALSRLGIAAKLIDWTGIETLIDMGASNERVRVFIPKDIQYVPVDYITFTDETVLCDFNKYEFPLKVYDPDTTCILSMGNLGYCKDWQWYLRTVSENCTCFILGHDDFPRVSREYRRTNWTRYNALFDHEIIQYMLGLGFDLKDAVDFRLHTTVYKFEKRI